MWYINSRGINVGAILSNLGLNIYSNLWGKDSLVPSNISTTNLELPLSEPINNQNIISTHGFFRQLGKKLLEMLDLYIEKMKDKRQKYN
jgi:hypothetical protein